MRKISGLLVGAALLCFSNLAIAEDGVTDTEIHVGDVTILTGPGAFIGAGVTRGSKLAVAEINANGGINGRKLVLHSEDDGNVPSRSVQALRKLLEQIKVFSINGTSGSSHVLAMLPTFIETSVPVIV